LLHKSGACAQLRNGYTFPTLLYVFIVIELYSKDRILSKFIQQVWNIRSEA
jgi:hypothetical protein